MEIVFHIRLKSQFRFRVVRGQQNNDCGFSLLNEDLTQQVMETSVIVIIIVVIVIIIVIIIVIHCYCYTLLVFV